MIQPAPPLKSLIAALNDGQSYTVPQLSSKLNCSESELTSQLSRLESLAVPMQKNGDRIALLEHYELLCEKEIYQNLPETLRNEIQLDLFDCIDSTNHYLKKQPKTSYPKFCIAECQTQGRARINRQWHSPFGQNIYFSCAYQLQQPIQNLLGLSLVTSLAVLRALQQSKHADELQIKWPNDILWHHYKLAGNLIETQFLSEKSITAIIGIGINVNMIEVPSNTIKRDWISLRHIVQHRLNRNQIIAHLIIELLSALKEFQKHGLDPFAEQWRRFDYLLGKNIHIQQGQQQWHGIAQGINPQGHLMLKTKSEPLAFTTGDASVYYEHG